MACSLSSSEEYKGLEVYIVFKTLGHESYWGLHHGFSHHVCVLKDPSSGKFYFTDLQTENGSKGSGIQLRFGEYTFIRPEYNLARIYYLPVGHTKKSLWEIGNYVREHPLNQKQYNLISQNCQSYVRMCIAYLDIYDLTPAVLTMRSWDPANLLYSVSDPKYLTLEPSIIDKITDAITAQVAREITQQIRVVKAAGKLMAQCQIQ
ncbi:unnamed protein product [Adineta steineri]|uniref:PPPDE domain-containing protein n=1 Tax=Adineta steineri TaxID=433720 RepID=A0A819FHE1_9BILA|nr:unnamed protein product [Adineta steineri]CAF1478312.1 unnamed protein product [Adineta steineri]CAF3865922.1 unnamed protein product [Adineta steineri]CAF4017335.1 unnamed protein product [Adineta steineri]